MVTFLIFDENLTQKHVCTTQTQSFKFDFLKFYSLITFIWQKVTK